MGDERAGSADLMSIGQHCAHPDCRQLDFLPFQCDCCFRTFCLDHRRGPISRPRIFGLQALMPHVVSWFVRSVHYRVQLHCSVAPCSRRTYKAHSCAHARSEGSDTIVCPLCARAIKLGPDEDANQAWTRHQGESCDPSNYAKARKSRFLGREFHC